MLAIASCGGSSPLAGTYTAKVSGSRVRVFDGQWTLTLKKGGSYTIQRGPTVALSRGPGSYYTGSRLVITNAGSGGCGGAGAIGSYGLKHTGNTVTLTTIRDPCFLRPLVLARSFKRTS